MTRVFICHATEDKEALVRPLALALRQAGLEVWFDEFVLKVGDSLRREIDRGLADCDHGIVVLSPAFFSKQWPQWELDGLVARELSEAQSILLPIWYEVSREEVMKFSPPLANRVAARFERGLDALVADLLASIRAASDLSRKADSPVRARRHAADFDGYWDLEATSAEMTCRRRWKYLGCRGFLDHWHHAAPAAFLYGHMRTAFPELFWTVRRDSPPVALFEGPEPASPPTMLPEKSGEIGDLLFDLEPCQSIRIRRLYGAEDATIQVPFTEIVRFRLDGEALRRLEIYAFNSNALAVQMIFPVELESEVISAISTILESHRDIEFVDTRL